MKSLHVKFLLTIEREYCWGHWLPTQNCYCCCCSGFTSSSFCCHVPRNDFIYSACAYIYFACMGSAPSNSLWARKCCIVCMNSRHMHVLHCNEMSLRLWYTQWRVRYTVSCHITFTWSDHELMFWLRNRWILGGNILRIVDEFKCVCAHIACRYSNLLRISDELG